MKFDLGIVSVLLATFAPPLVLLLGISFDRYQRKRWEVSAAKKTFTSAGIFIDHPPENATDTLMNHLLAASILAAFSGAGVFTFAGFFGAKPSR